ncbi:MAG TPA: hypothetical protein VFM54_00385 [Micromonosporaceae bacterium]|nr:hypothetical protein [Micromonosporaceae bacterium]
MVAAFELWFHSCRVEGGTAQSVLGSFGRFIGWLARLGTDQTQPLYQALGADNAAVVQEYMAVHTHGPHAQ